METNTVACFNCSNPLPITGYFCGACLTQFKCKTCDSTLQKDYIGCINCGTPKEAKVEIASVSGQNINTFRLHETPSDRTIEATFSNDVAKDIAETLKDAATARRIKSIGLNTSVSNSNDGTGASNEFEEAEIETKENSYPAAKNNTSELKKGDEHPSMKYIVMNNLPLTEEEWIVVYAYYSSNFGENKFTRKDIISKYEESGRKTSLRIKNLSRPILSAVKSKYINPINDEDFSIVAEGIKKATEIISRTSGSSPRGKSSSKEKKEDANDNNESTSKNRKSTGNSNKKLTDLDFYPAGQKSLTDFIKGFKIKNDSERNLLFTHYLSNVLKISKITLDHLYTCYDEVDYKIPENMAKSLSNTTVRGWLKSDKSNITITTKGVNKIKFWDKKD